MNKRELTEKYKFLQRKSYSPPDYHEGDSWLDDMPNGWFIAFGEMLVEELAEAIKADGLQDDYHIIQIKEKFGELRWYDNGGKHVSDVIDKYSLLSQNICIACGQPDVGAPKGGWILPLCFNCWSGISNIPAQDKLEKMTTYRKSIFGNECMENTLEYRTFTEDGVSLKTSVDISETANAIRKRWSSLEV